MDNLCMLFIIINTSDEKRTIKIINKYKLGFKVIMHGEGTASSSLLEYFDLTDDKKTIITSVLPPLICRQLLKEIEQKVKVHELGKGIAFSIPLTSSPKYMLDFYKKHKMEDIKMNEANKHLIVTIVNQGNAEKVMTEAKKAGATGGTTINGRSLEVEKTIKFLNIAIEPEKDIILIIASTKKKNNIMNAILENCGLKTPGAGICFSLPVDYAVGLNPEIEH